MTYFEKDLVGGTQESCLENANFRELSEMVSSGSVNIKLILANPRTSSTLLETSFAQCTAVGEHVHEPFSRSRSIEDIKEGYATIVDRIKTRAEGSIQPVNVVVKEISRSLTIGNEYKRFLTLVGSPPILLVRNPLLSTESKIRAVLKGLNLRKSTSLTGLLLNYYSQTLGYTNADLLTEGQSDEETNAELGLQRRLLDYFAVSKGHSGWESMLEETFTQQNYKPFEEILRDERFYRVEPPATLERMHYLQSIEKPFVIVDSTDYRLDSQTVIPALCQKWDIPFSGNMIAWGNEGEKLQTGQSNQKAWYERVESSTGIDQPYEISPALTDFPDFITTHLRDVEIPAYHEMFNHYSRVKPTETILERVIDVPITKGVYRRLQEVEVLSQELDLTNRANGEVFRFLSERGLLAYSSFEAESLEEAYRRRGALVKLPISDLDPIFYLMSNPGILSNQRFLRVNGRYGSTFNAITALSYE